MSDQNGDEGFVETPSARPLPVSGADLVRPRQGDLDPNTIAELAERALGLSAPEAPPEGDLVANRSGWLIGTGELRQQLYPAFQGRADRWTQLLYLLTAPCWLLASIFHSPLAMIPIGIPIPIVLTTALIIPRLMVRRQLKRAKQTGRLAEAAEGTLVRVTGTIAPQATVPTLFRGVPAVLFRNRIASAQETRGLDFLLDLDEGGQAKVAVRRAFLLESPTRTREPPSCGPVSADTVDGRSVLRSRFLEHMLRSDSFVPLLRRPWFGRYESSVGPGDRVEVCGVVRHVPAPDLETRFLRVPPMRSVLAAGEDAPLLVRRA